MATVQVHELRRYWPALGRQAGCTVLTPPGWRPGARDTYPVLYLLHGSSDVHTSFLEHTDVAELAAAHDALVVMPEGGRLGFYTDWRVADRGGTIPHWERFHLRELPNVLEDEFGASQTRMVAGLSMGGYGALRYAMRHPGRFRAAASLSGLVHLTRPGMATLLGTLSIREGMRPGRIWGPRRFCWDSWAANDPYLHADALRPTPIYLAAGDGHRVPGEEFVAGMGSVERYAHSMNTELAQRMAACGVDVTTSFTAGTHFWTTWRRALTEFWPYAMKTLHS